MTGSPKFLSIQIFLMQESVSDVLDLDVFSMSSNLQLLLNYQINLNGVGIESGQPGFEPGLRSKMSPRLLNRRSTIENRLCRLGPNAKLCETTGSGFTFSDVLTFCHLAHLCHNITSRTTKTQLVSYC
jgi:hypothetical protein